MTYLAQRISPRTHKHANSQQDDTRDLQLRVALAPDDASQHRRHAPETAQDDVHGDRDVEGKRPVVEHVDAVEEECNVCPFPHRHAAFAIGAAARSEEWRWQGYDGDEGELQKCDQ